LSISTFDTDYVLVRTVVLEKAKAALRRHFELIDCTAEAAGISSAAHGES
jgi:hypothetical protein